MDNSVHKSYLVAFLVTILILLAQQLFSYIQMIKLTCPYNKVHKKTPQHNVRVQGCGYNEELFAQSINAGLIDFARY